LRPVISAARVGEQRAVVWKFVKRNPAWARRSKVGVEIGPPNVLEAPKPTSSVRMSRILGAPLGGCSSLGKSGTESLAVRPMRPLKGGSGRGSVSCAARGASLPTDITIAIASVMQTPKHLATALLSFIAFSSTRVGMSGFLSRPWRTLGVARVRQQIKMTRPGVWLSSADCTRSAR